MPEGEEMFKFHGFSGPCPKPPLPQPPTFGEYLASEMDAGRIDFHLRVVRGPNGELDFYIHPQNADGNTGDFTVAGGKVSAIPNGHGAGSRPTT